MRLWSVHPKYLDPQGLAAVWREALLAQKVLRKLTKGYRHHPQLRRFKDCPSPLSAISAYLKALYDQSLSRGYRFDALKIGRRRRRVSLSVTRGQLAYEWQHLRRKLKRRNPVLFRKWAGLKTPQAHPLFRVRGGPVAAWENTHAPNGQKIR